MTESRSRNVLEGGRRELLGRWTPLVPLGGRSTLLRMAIGFSKAFFTADLGGDSLPTSCSSSRTLPSAPSKPDESTIL